MGDRGAGRFHFTIPELPSEPLWEVEVEEKRKPERIRARDAEQAKQRIRGWLGYTPVAAKEVTDDE